MPRADGRIEPGQKLSKAISARAWNRAQEAADIVLGTNPSLYASDAKFQSAPYTWVYAKNTTGATVPRWGVMSITGLQVTPTGDSAARATRQFEEMPVLTGGSPSSSQTRCVAVEPLANNAIGRVAIAGAVQIKTDNLGLLNDAFVVWKDATWSLVVLAGAARLGSVGATWSKGEDAEVTMLKGDGGSVQDDPTFTAKNWFANVTVPSGQTRKVACAHVNGYWILIAAECDA